MYFEASSMNPAAPSLPLFELLRHRAHAEPAAVEVDYRPLRPQDLEYLLPVGRGVLLHLRARQDRPRPGLTGGIADHPGEVPDQKHHPMAHVLEVFHFSDDDGVAEVQIRRRRVESDLDGEGPALPLRALQLAEELVLADDLHGPLAQVFQLLLRRGERRGAAAGGRHGREVYNDSGRSAISPGERL